MMKKILLYIVTLMLIMSCATLHIDKSIGPTIVNINSTDTIKTKSIIKDTVLVPNVIYTSTVYFDNNSYELNALNKKIISNIYEKASNNSVILVNGYTDDKGSYKYNLDLSLNRAKAVESEFIKLGFPKEKIITKGFGLIKSNREKLQNRKVEIFIY